MFRGQVSPAKDLTASPFVVKLNPRQSSLDSDPFDLVSLDCGCEFFVRKVSENRHRPIWRRSYLGVTNCLNSGFSRMEMNSGFFRASLAKSRAFGFAPRRLEL